MELEFIIRALVVIFFCFLFIVLIRFPTIFLRKHGKFHALTGAVYLLWLLLGYYDAFTNAFWNLDSEKSIWLRLVYDTILGVLGVILTLTAAFEFQHKGVKNVASGVLDEHATVTYEEMIEHSFYQVLNLFQICYLHLLAVSPFILTSSLGVTIFTSFVHHSKLIVAVICDTLNITNFSFEPSFSSFVLLFRVILGCIAATPWLFRDYFPVNSFSDNYVKKNEKSTDFIKLLYRLKKYQYIIYKHFILHGINICVARSGTSPVLSICTLTIIKNAMLNGGDFATAFTGEQLVRVNECYFSSEVYFRLFWILLNTSYVMEFFMQTLVKKKYMKQITMLTMQLVLMSASTLSALQVINAHVYISVALYSVALNFLNRGHDFVNVCVTTIAFSFLSVRS